MKLWGLFGAALLLAAGGRAAAYDERVHDYLSSLSYAGARDAITPGVGPIALREALYRAGATAHDAGVRARFSARYPSLGRFDSWELKRLLGLNPDAHVGGLDEQPLPDERDPRALFARASRLPDDDGRNRDRFAHDVHRKVLDDSYGRPLPEDPATLEMGGLTGLSSQAHAHYGLPHLPFSDDPAVLKSDPRRFAVPPTVHTFGAEFADEYSKLAVIAWQLPGGRALALVHAGAAAHHLEDVANQIHTVQVGLYAFFFDAKLAAFRADLLSVGGLLHPRPSFLSIGLDIISNHHLLAESLYAKHLLTPGDPVRAATESMPPDDVLERSLAAVGPGCSPSFGRDLAELLIDRSSFEGAAVYRAIRAVAAPRLSDAGQHFSEGDDPDGAIRPGADLAAFERLEERGASRSKQILAAWWRHFSACAAEPPETIARLAEQLIAERLTALDAVEARERDFVPAPPEKASINPWFPIGTALAFLGAALLAWRAVAGRRNKTRQR